MYAHDVLQNAVPQIIQADEATQVVTNAAQPKYWTSGYVDLQQIRNVCLISNALGDHY